MQPKFHSALILLGFLLLTFAVAGVGGWLTASSVGTWYQTLQKPALNPPDWVFGPVWTTLYAAMAVAGWGAWRAMGWRGGRWTLLLWMLQLALNLMWSALFFYLRRPGWAAAEIIVLWISILAALIALWRVRRWAGALFIPYLLWVSFAAYLTWAIWLKN